MSLYRSNYQWLVRIYRLPPFAVVRYNPRQSVGPFVGLVMAKLTERGAQTAKAGRHGDGGGLHLVVSDTGRKKWILRYQVAGAQYLQTGRLYEYDGYDAQWRGIYDDKGRLMVAICHNMDLGDSWENADDPRYPERFSALGFRIGVNYVVYAMTH